MGGLLIFIGLVIAIMGIILNERWYTKLAQGVGGLVIAAIPFVMHFVFHASIK